MDISMNLFKHHLAVSSASSKFKSQHFPLPFPLAHPPFLTLISSSFFFSSPPTSSIPSHFPLPLISPCLLSSSITSFSFFLLLFLLFSSVCCSASLAGTLTSHLHYPAMPCPLSLLLTTLFSPSFLFLSALFPFSSKFNTLMLSLFSFKVSIIIPTVFFLYKCDHPH